MTKRPSRVRVRGRRIHSFHAEVDRNGVAAKLRFGAISPDTVQLDDASKDGIEFIEWLGYTGANIRLIVVTALDPTVALAEKLATALAFAACGRVIYHSKRTIGFT